MLWRPASGNFAFATLDRPLRRARCWEAEGGGATAGSIHHDMDTYAHERVARRRSGLALRFVKLLIGRWWIITRVSIF